MEIQQKIQKVMKEISETGYNTAQDNENDLKICQSHCDTLNSQIGDLNERDGYNCDKCNNTGFHYKPVLNNGRYTVTAVICDCIKVRNLLLKLAKSGLGNVIYKYTFEKYIAEQEWQKSLKESAEAFVSEKEKWFFIGGQSGCGKTHLCTAICNKLLKQGKDVYYMLWVDDIRELKSTVMDNEKHLELLSKCKTVDVLYIDDFFKNGKDKDGRVQLPTPADIQIAYYIINSRYNNKNMVTIISSERTIYELENIDEAISGRITEKANYGEYIFNIRKDKRKNYRRKSIKDF